jgi:pyridoxal phosphate enzyme (YggS family)
MITKETLAANLAAIQGRIAAAAQRAGRVDQPKLIAVTKGQPAQLISWLAELRVADIGESYMDEALPKKASISAHLTWHMIGHVQSRKAKDAATFDMVHSVDSLKLAERLNRFAAEAGKQLPVLLECNIGAEANKHGWAVSDKNGVDAFFREAEQIVKLDSLQPLGLMGMAPIVASPDKARPYFAKMRDLRDELRLRFPHLRWNELSMGMSDDFEAAVLEGATMLRIGTALVGARPQEA